MIWDRMLNAELAEPAIREVHLNFATDQPLRADREDISHDQHPDHQFRIDRRPTHGRIMRCKFAAEPGKIESSIDLPYQMIFRDCVIELKLVEKLRLFALQPTHHGLPPPRFASARWNHGSPQASTDFCNKICQLLTFGLRYRQRVHPPHHSITSSARASNVGAMSRPSALAVFRLITKSYFTGCSTGRSAGLAPLRILSTKVAVRRNRSEKSAAYAIRPPASAYSLCANIVGSRFFSAKSASRVRAVNNMELDSTISAPARASFTAENARSNSSGPRTPRD